MLGQRAAGLTLAATLLSGCVQATRHSNTMVFGTNTVFGISAGTDATSTPNVTVGYKRQEAVVLPLYANTGHSGDVLTPCANASSEVVVACKFQGTGGGEDTYSVLASFGAKFEGASDGKPRATGEIAQYFATGHAARGLALRAGAAAVSTGDAAKASATITPEVAAILAERRTVYDKIADNFTNSAVAADPASVTAAMQKLDTSVRSGTTFADACANLDKAACASRLRSGQDLYIISLPKSKLDTASNHVF